MSNVFSVKTQLEHHRLFLQEVVKRLIHLLELRRKTSSPSRSKTLHHKQLQLCKKIICLLIRWTAWLKSARKNSETRAFRPTETEHCQLWSMKYAQASVYYSDFHRNSYLRWKVVHLSADLGVIALHSSVTSWFIKLIKRVNRLFEGEKHLQKTHKWLCH